jgi:hypothetical protein
MTPGKVGTTTAQHFNGSRTLVAYGKLEEMQKQFRKGVASAEDVEAAKGLLRIESRLKKSALTKLAENHSVACEAQELLTFPVAHDILSKTLSDLTFDKPKISPYKRDQELVKHFKSDALKMAGLIEWRKRYGDDFWKFIGMPSSTYYRLRSQLQEANLWNASATVELPALALSSDLSSDLYNNPTLLSPMRIEAEDFKLDSTAIM